MSQQHHRYAARPWSVEPLTSCHLELICPTLLCSFCCLLCRRQPSAGALGAEYRGRAAAGDHSAGRQRSRRFEGGRLVSTFAYRASLLCLLHIRSAEQIRVCLQRLQWQIGPSLHQSIRTASERVWRSRQAAGAERASSEARGGGIRRLRFGRTIDEEARETKKEIRRSRQKKE